MCFGAKEGVSCLVSSILSPKPSLKGGCWTVYQTRKAPYLQPNPVSRSEGTFDLLNDTDERIKSACSVTIQQHSARMQAAVCKWSSLGIRTQEATPWLLWGRGTVRCRRRDVPPPGSSRQMSFFLPTPALAN